MAAGPRRPRARDAGVRPPRLARALPAPRPPPAQGPATEDAGARASRRARVESNRIERRRNSNASRASSSDGEGALGGADAGGVEAQASASYWSMIKTGYNELVNAIIRPPRAVYDLSTLGPKKFRLEGKVYVRNDIELQNERGLTLRCSHWTRFHDPRLTAPAPPRPCMVYLHGNASCRAEALECLPSVLSSGISLFALDFSGSGLSDGEYISLGFYEREDVQTVVNHLRASGSVSSIGLWGRSMGAVTALMFVDRDPSIAALVLDSPFSALRIVS